MTRDQSAMWLDYEDAFREYGASPERLRCLAVEHLLRYKHDRVYILLFHSGDVARHVADLASPYAAEELQQELADHTALYLRSPDFAWVDYSTLWNKYLIPRGRLDRLVLQRLVRVLNPSATPIEDGPTIALYSLQDVITYLPPCLSQNKLVL